jgi:hypothetical protein
LAAFIRFPDQPLNLRALDFQVRPQVGDLGIFFAYAAFVIWFHIAAFNFSGLLVAHRFPFGVSRARAARHWFIKLHAKSSP